VRESFHPPEIKHAAGAFDGVEGPKDIGERVGRSRVFFQPQKEGFDAVEDFVPFEDKFLDVVGVVGHPGSVAARRARSP
jgi:hypothetical protein